MKTAANPYSRSHAHMLCVTGGQQPYSSLQQPFIDEQIGQNGSYGIDPQFLDAPCFTGAGCTIFLDFSDGPAIVSGITILDARLS